MNEGESTPLSHTLFFFFSSLLDYLLLYRTHTCLYACVDDDDDDDVYFVFNGISYSVPLTHFAFIFFTVACTHRQVAPTTSGVCFFMINIQRQEYNAVQVIIGTFIGSDGTDAKCIYKHTYTHRRPAVFAYIYIFIFHRVILYIYNCACYTYLLICIFFVSSFLSYIILSLYTAYIYTYSVDGRDIEVGGKQMK